MFPLQEKWAQHSKYDLLVVELCSIEYDHSTCILDSGATNHICSFFQETSSWRMLAEGEITLRIETGEVVSVRSVGNLKLFFGDRFIILDNVLFVPRIKRNLISISCLLEQLYRVYFEINELFICKRGIHICSAKLENNLYMLKLSETKAILNTVMFKTTETQNKRQRFLLIPIFGT